MRYAEIFLAMHESASVAVKEALEFIGGRGEEPSIQEAIISLLYKMSSDEDVTGIWAPFVLGPILECEPSEAVTVLEEKLPILNAIPGLHSEVKGRFYP
jgi:hypothetical protein